MKWFIWTSLESFNSWLSGINKAEGLPKKSIDSQGNECDPIIENYYSATIISNVDVRCLVEEQHSEGLTSSSAPEEPARER